MGYPTAERAVVADRMNRIADRCEVRVARTAQAAACARAAAAESGSDQAVAALAAAKAELATVTLARDVAERITTIAAGLGARLTAPEPEPPPPEQPPVPVRLPRGKAKPPFSAVGRSFIAEKSRVVEGHREYDQQTVRQTESTLQLWADLLGDRPIDGYDGADAGRFRDLLLRMPASHGKSGTRAEVHRLVRRSRPSGGRTRSRRGSMPATRRCPAAPSGRPTSDASP